MATDSFSPRRGRAAALIAAAGLIVAAASFAYLHSNQPSKPAIRAAIPPPSSPSPTSPSLWNGPCAPTALSFTGVFNEYATVGKGQTCPTGSFNQARIVLMNGTKHDFLLYIEVKGAYHGPGTYALPPWPHQTLGVVDGVAKVQIREYVSGRLFQSSSGFLTIDSLENGGWVYAGLGASTYSPVDVALNIAGWWSCS